VLPQGRNCDLVGSDEDSGDDATSWGGGTTTSSIDVAESTKKRLNNSRPEADPSMRNSNYSSGMASKFIAHQHTTWRHHRP
jgi:hypothetical protein